MSGRARAAAGAAPRSRFDEPLCAAAGTGSAAPGSVLLCMSQPMCIVLGQRIVLGATDPAQCAQHNAAVHQPAHARAARHARGRSAQHGIHCRRPCQLSSTPQENPRVPFMRQGAGRDGRHRCILPVTIPNDQAHPKKALACPSCGRALRATDGTDHAVLGRVLVSFANPAKLDAQRTKATARTAGAAGRAGALAWPRLVGRHARLRA